VVQAAIGGQEVTPVYEGEMNFALAVRFAPEYRHNIDAIRAIPVALPSSDPRAPTAYIALGELGEVKLEMGAAYIYRENAQRFVPLKYSVRSATYGSDRGRSATGHSREAAAAAGLPRRVDGDSARDGGRAKRLAVIVPLSLVLIMMLLYSLFNSVRDSLLALAGIPFAVAGGILGLYVAGLNFSVSAAIGFISLFGVSSMDGILLVSYIRKNLEEGLSNDEAIISPADSYAADFHDRPVSVHRPGAGASDRHRRPGAAAARAVVVAQLLSPICGLLVIDACRMVMPDGAGNEQVAVAPQDGADRGALSPAHESRQQVQPANRQSEAGQADERAGAGEFAERDLDPAAAGDLDHDDAGEAAEDDEIARKAGAERHRRAGELGVIVADIGQHEDDGRIVADDVAQHRGQNRSGAARAGRARPRPDRGSQP
jgi:hypothetical protein